MATDNKRAFDEHGPKYDLLLEWFAAINNRVLVALSGGVDSAVVALAASMQLGKDVIALTAKCNTTSTEEITSAISVADELGIRHEVIEYDELRNPNFVRNDSTRCYHCRRDLAARLLARGKEIGAKVIVDGTHVDDMGDNRPGMMALNEAGIKHPLLEVGLTKSDIRRIAECFGLSVYNKPANSCLASRIPHGREVTYQRLARIEQAESIMKEIFGVTLVRVRDHDDLARIEVERGELELLFDVKGLEVADKMIKELGFKHVSIDMRGYTKSGLTVLN